MNTKFKSRALVLLWTIAQCSQVNGYSGNILAIFLRHGDFWSTSSKTEEPNLSNGILQDFIPTIPDPGDAATMARYIVHHSYWGSLSHISLQSPITGYPLARVYSISDGPIEASTGVPYFYMTPNDPELKDIYKDPRVSLTLTLAQTPYCRSKALDPEDPRCGQVILTGKFEFLKNKSSEWYQAKKAMFSRHPVMKHWPDSHHWVFCKLQIGRILLVDNFGGNKYPNVEDYFKAQPDASSSLDNPFLQPHYSYNNE